MATLVSGMMEIRREVAPSDRAVWMTSSTVLLRLVRGIGHLLIFRSSLIGDEIIERPVVSPIDRIEEPSNHTLVSFQVFAHGRLVTLGHRGLSKQGFIQKALCTFLRSSRASDRAPN